VKYARLGTTASSISRLGIGGWQAGGSGPWGAGPGADDEQAIAAIRNAIDRGVSWVDTAASYGLGHSEEVMRRALEPWSVGEDVLIFTKCGHPWEPPDRIWTELSPDSIRRECEDSLRRLGVERIDLLQFHHHDPSVPVEDSWAVMDELGRAGKIRWAGVSNFDVNLLERCEAVRHVDAVQPELSLLRPQAERDVIPWAARHGTGVIVYSPLASGLLGRRGARVPTLVDGRDLPERRRPASLIDRLTMIADTVGLDVVRLAIAWTLSIDGVTGAICGARTPEQVDGWAEAVDVTLDAVVLDQIRSVISTPQSDDQG
jgi:aryl-alcohol dehydrogenase-like predicted oxidoreductase